MSEEKITDTLSEPRLSMRLLDMKNENDATTRCAKCNGLSGVVVWDSAEMAYVRVPRCNACVDRDMEHASDRTKGGIYDEGLDYIYALYGDWVGGILYQFELCEHCLGWLCLVTDGPDRWMLQARDFCRCENYREMVEIITATEAVAQARCPACDCDGSYCKGTHHEVCEHVVPVPAPVTGEVKSAE